MSSEQTALAVVEKLRKEIGRILVLPDVRAKLVELVLTKKLLEAGRVKL